LLHYILDYQFFAKIVYDHDSSTIYLAVFDLHLLGEKHLIESFEIVGIRFIEYVSCLVKQEDELLLRDNSLPLHFYFIVGFDSFDFECCFE
jgi:hypothetical protein